MINLLIVACLASMVYAFKSSNVAGMFWTAYSVLLVAVMLKWGI